jgi:5-methylcytosine-specific restriction endonuclease McrA
MPSPKVPCPVCGGPKAKASRACRKCSQPYERTAEMREAMSRLTTGKPKPHLLGRKRPEVGKKIAEWWTEDRRDQKRQEMMGRNPQSRYHGLSAKSAARLVQRIGRCERCQHDGSGSRLSVHHKNRDKHDQRLENLEILCHRCHMREHAKAGESGFHAMWRKRKTSLS